MARWFLALFSIAILNGRFISNAPAGDLDTAVVEIFRERCLACHGSEQQKAGLRLDRIASIHEGGDSGPAIVSGKSSESLLLERVLSRDTEIRMPPKGEPLTSAQIEQLQKWIDAGAPWSIDENRDPRLSHWAWQPIRRPDLPNDTFPSNSLQPGIEFEPSRNAIDLLIRKKLAEAGLHPSKQASRETLIRRLTFDLHGLPPTPEEVRAFESDDRPDAYERLVDRLLESPRYGERWARHWLDIAHYADTHGFERDQRRDNAYRYRDYVINALNRDLPYDRFLKEQIAGDFFAPDQPEAVIATGFLAAGPWDFVGQAETPSPVIKRLARADDLDDMVTQVMTATCGITVNCARCHNHKLDPISQQEYYSLWAVFAGVKRGERLVSQSEKERIDQQREQLQRQLQEALTELGKLEGKGVSLADVVGGGNGFGTGLRSIGIDPLSGNPQTENRGFLTGVVPNEFRRSTIPMVDGVFVPHGGIEKPITVTSTGLQATGIPATSGETWDAIRNGPVHSQHSTKLAGVDYGTAEHSLLALHANVGITFDIDAMRNAGLAPGLRLVGKVGYFGETPKQGASLRILLDGKTVQTFESIGRDDGPFDFDVAIADEQRFLTFIATDGGNGIGHDQLGLIDTRVVPKRRNFSEEEAAVESALAIKVKALKQQLADLPEPARMYGIQSEQPPAVNVLLRGSPETPAEQVAPGTLQLVAGLPGAFRGDSMNDQERRGALAEWITDSKNPLTRRVLVNRLWQHHFGTGLVATSSDFGLGGATPTHPELLDYLADEFQKRNWSLKAIHRLICCSATYRQESIANQPDAMKKDTGNRWLWRQNPRRLDAESLKDSVLAVAGTLNQQMFGPGYQDFDYTEAYAPVYRYKTADRPELWRRSIYRFVVRTTTHQLLTTLDCPSPSNLTPVRNVTTTPLQSLALLNNQFMLQQAEKLAQRIEFEASDEPGRIDRAFRLTLGRRPSSAEMSESLKLVREVGLPIFARMLLNANEFVYID